jgi:hypothetical protein
MFRAQKRASIGEFQMLSPERVPLLRGITLRKYFMGGFVYIYPFCSAPLSFKAYGFYATPAEPDVNI